MERVFLLLGSNIGNKSKTLLEAIELLAIECGSITSQSKTYKSEPWGFESKDDFLNVAVELETNLEPYSLLESILDIENRLGRTRVEDGKYHSRTIDIDIIFYGERVIVSQSLIIPHPNMHLRRFVLLPLSEICPRLIHPTLNVSVATLLKICEDNSQVVFI